jgi:hypothetical protein
MECQLSISRRRYTGDIFPFGFSEPMRHSREKPSDESIWLRQIDIGDRGLASRCILGDDTQSPDIDPGYVSSLIRTWDSRGGIHPADQGCVTVRYMIPMHRLSLPDGSMRGTPRPMDRLSAIN